MRLFPASADPRYTHMLVNTIQFESRLPTPEEFSTLRVAVGWGVPASAALDRGLAGSAYVTLMAAKGMEGFYEHFGFISRPDDRYGAGMILPPAVIERWIAERLAE